MRDAHRNTKGEMLTERNGENTEKNENTKKNGRPDEKHTESTFKVRLNNFALQYLNRVYILYVF